MACSIGQVNRLSLLWLSISSISDINHSGRFMAASLLVISGVEIRLSNHADLRRSLNKQAEVPVSCFVDVMTLMVLSLCLKTAGYYDPLISPHAVEVGPVDVGHLLGCLPEWISLS